MSSVRYSRREKRCRAIVASLESHGEETAKTMEGLLSPYLEAGETFPDLRLLLRLLGRLLRDRLGLLLRAADAHDSRRRDARFPREERDAAAAAVRRELVDLRQAFDAVFGRGQFHAFLGLKRQTPRPPKLLLEQARRAMRRLGKKGLVLPPERGGLRFDSAYWVRKLRSPTEALGQALGETELKPIHERGTWHARRRARAALDRASIAVALVLRGLYRLCGLDEYARSLGPGHAESEDRQKRREAGKAEGKEAGEKGPAKG